MLIRNIAVVDEHYEALPGHNILVEGNTIAAITAEPPRDYRGEVYDGEGKIAVPGFFNLHCHVPMCLLRGYGEGLPLHRWLTERMFPFEALLSEEDVYWGSLLGIAEMLASGAAAFSDMYFHMPAVARAVAESGIKANLCHGASSEGDGGTAYTTTSAYAATQRLLDIAKDLGGRLVVDAGLHAEYTSDAQLCEELADFAKRQNLRVHLHLSETQKEHEECKQKRGCTAAQWLAARGLLDVPAVAAHCVWVEPADIELLARHGVTAAHCPSSNLKLGSGIAPLPALREAGVPVCIGTDGAASNNNLNVLEELNLAALVQKGVRQDPLFLSMAQLFEMACRNGAKAQGRADCGALKAGNRADIVLYNTDVPHMLPLIDPMSNLLYSAQQSDIVLNMVDGVVVYKNGEYTGIDIEKVKFHARRIAAEKLETLGR